jgi:SH3 domain-containing YSC84-like protein 1
MKLLSSSLLLILVLAGQSAPALFAAEAVPVKTDRFSLRIETSEAIIREFQADPQLALPTDVLRYARGIAIVNQVKGGLVLGLQFGNGVVLARRADGTWSLPVFIKAGEASLGLQIGGQRTETIYVFMTDEAIQLLYAGRTNIGVDARALVGPRDYEAEQVSRALLSTPVLVYGRNHGYYAGATVKGGWIERDDDTNRKYYNTTYVLPELLYGDYVAPPATVRPLIDFITKITR